MKRIVNVILLMFFTSGVHSGNEIGPIRAVQIFTLNSPDVTGLTAEFRQLKRAGFNTIIFRVFKNPYDGTFKFVQESRSSGVYFPTTQEPLVADALSPVITVAHSLDLKVFAWITTRKSQWILAEKPEWDSQSVNLDTGRPESGGHLDIFRVDVQKRLSTMLAEIVESGVDGILLQDDLVSRQNQDFYTNVWRNFRGSAFLASDLSSLFDFSRKPQRYQPDYYNWSRFKSRALAQVLKRLVMQVKAIKPQVAIAANLYYEIVASPSNGRQWLSQDLEDWITIPVDYWAVMAYQRQISRELKLSVEDVAEKLKTAQSYLIESYLIPESKVIWKLQVHDWATTELIPSEEFDRLLSVFTPGQFALVPYRGIESAVPFIESFKSHQ